MITIRTMTRERSIRPLPFTPGSARRDLGLQPALAHRRLDSISGIARTPLLRALVVSFAAATLLAHPFPETWNARAGTSGPAGIGASSGSSVVAAPAVFARRITASVREVRFGGWTQLRYTTSKFLIFTGDLTMSRTLTGETISVRSESRARLFGSVLVDSWSVSTMNRTSGRPLTFLEVKPGKRADRWSFQGEGIIRETLKPHKTSPDEPLERWKLTKTVKLPGARAGSKRPESVDGTPTKLDDDPAAWVHDYISMIVRLRDLPLTRTGDATTVLVSTSRGAAALTIRVGEERRKRRTLTDLETGIRQTVDMHELRLRLLPAGGSATDTKGFLDMEGETELWVDSATRTLVEISGNVPKVPGRVVITLAGYRVPPA